MTNEKASNQHKEFGVIHEHDPVVVKVLQSPYAVLEAKMSNQHPGQQMVY